MKRLKSNTGFISILASITSIIIGLLFGFVLLLILDAKNAPAGMANMLTNGITNMGNVLYRSIPLILVGLSVAFAFKVGCFNIGASGQYTMGAVFALFCALTWNLPWYVCLLAAILGGAFWGLFPGLFKSLFNVNEVITSIMMNWIGMNVSVFWVSNVKVLWRCLRVTRARSFRSSAWISFTATSTSASSLQSSLRLLFGSLFPKPHLAMSFVLAVLTRTALFTPASMQS